MTELRPLNKGKDKKSPEKIANNIGNLLYK